MMAEPRPSPFTSRRQFIIGGMAALGAAWAGVAAQSLLFPAASAATAEPVRFPLAELPIGGTRALAYAGAPALVVRSAESVRCFSLICTHLGCTVGWEEGAGEFYCPCHEGRFDRYGEPVAGPPVIPLEEIPLRVDGDTVVVGEAA
jgi:nitrite reductase/ring-hydroxylating ferredoxin subunit